MDMNWHQALQESLSWLAIATFITLVCFTAAATLAVRCTRWGNQFWQLAGPYFNFRRSWRPLLVFALLLVLTLFSVRLNVLFSFWYNGFYSALQGLDQAAFWYMLGVFAVLATIHVLRSLFTFYVTQAFSIQWRVWLTKRLTNDWMHGDAYYRGQFLAEPVDNPDQRIELDANAFVTNSVTLALGAVSALVSLVAFTGILWSLSAPLAVAGVEVPRAMVFAVYLYVIVATWIAFRLGRPLIRLNFLNEKLTANFRYALMRLRENAENIAFYQGALVERGTLLGRFGALIVNAWALVFRNLKFSGFNLGVSQVAVVFPFILQAPRFFSGAIKLGDVMQTA
ncbi:MAG: ABC transporter ATP-binding protein/permease, partial [Pseudomonas putida]